MVRTVEQIEQELAILDQAVATLAQEFHNTYSQYLAALGQAVRQQLILASYHLCTQGYPEQFLKLSLQQRQHLQQSLRQMAKLTQTELSTCLKPIVPVDVFSPSSLHLNSKEVSEALSSVMDEDLTALVFEELEGGTEFVMALPLGDFPEEEPQTNEPPSNEAQEEPQINESQPDSDLQRAELGDELAGEEEPASNSALQEDIVPSRPLQPKDILRWQGAVEEGIIEQLRNLSHRVNRLLQQSKVLPGRLPEPILEVAARADLPTETVASPPNLLNLMIETESEDAKEATVTQVMTIRLRLSEIEFSDTSSSVWRSKIRDLMNKLGKLGREYQRKQRERSIAQAEAAWRSSWYED